ncbi:hypothetical protein BDW02DRAFT_553247 [Decorospora gaudefroyi]|uniref:Zn(2)-C6 fungal-type domain-containing protein n=1 Tax=Decorospora gaudefroyi TaxID=184978 RepID=A0A6A5KF89_9PLEO|nr:hypothetical protein BDW02DRAFT_553247 [Decorospora gaudefroyi]
MEAPIKKTTGKPRQRAWRPKTHSGCKTCKIRRVKCDEEKPQCKRCRSTGRTCDGYDPAFRAPVPPSSLSQVPPQSRIIRDLTRSQSPIYLASALRLETREERESFEFFISHAISSLRGFLDSPFWQREVLQAAHREPAIKHCVFALGAMYRRFFEGKGSHLTESDMSDKNLQFALRQSNHAIQNLVKEQAPGGAASGKDTVTMLTCCILFSSMCCLQGYQKRAILHLRSGIRMINEYESEKTEQHPIDIESLRTIFVGLDMQVRGILPTYMSPTWVAKPKTEEFLITPSSNLSMESLLAVLRYMESLLNHIFAFLQRSCLRPVEESDNVYSEYIDLITRFHRGAIVLGPLWKQAPAFGDEYIQPLVSLELLQCQMEYLLRDPRSDMVAKFPFLADFTPAREPFTTSFDATAHFERIFNLSTKLLPSSASVTPVFTTALGPTSALWLTALRAPSSCQALRKCAVQSMISHPRREGFWDGMIAGQIAQEALKLEQERTRVRLGIMDDTTGDLIVPEDLRIIAVFMTHPEDQDRMAKVEFSDTNDLAIGVPGKVQWLSW